MRKLHRSGERGIRTVPRVAPKPPARPRLGRAATLERQVAGRALVLSRHGVSRETVERLDAYVALLLAWQAKINLVAPSTIPDVWTRHVEDGLALHALARKLLRWADLGSGAGVPGLVLAILNAGRDGARVELVESNAKKAAFLRTVVRDLALAAVVHAERIEDCGPVLAGAEAIAARALAPLPDLFALVAPWVAPGAVCYFPKGRSHPAEIAEASALWDFDMVKHGSIEEGSVILAISNLRRRGPAKG